VSTISSTSGTSVSSAQTAAQQAAAAAQQALQAAGQSLISGSTGNTSIDPQTLVTTLVNAKVAGQQTSLTIEAANDNAQISAIGQLSAALAALQGALGPLQNGSLMSTFTATASGSGITATAGSGASAATYSVNVGQIAQTQNLTSSAFSSSTAQAMGTGALTISLGSQSMTLNVTSSNNSLTQIASAINSASNNPGISASIISGSDGAHLVLSSTLTGEANTINVSVGSGATGALATLGVQSVTGGTFASAGVAATTTAAAGGTLNVSYGGVSIPVTTKAGDTLSAVASEINTATSAAGMSVTAKVVTDSSGQQHLVVGSSSSSSASPVTVTTSSSDALLTGATTALPASTAAPATGTAVGASSIISLGSAGWTQTTAAQSAQFSVNGTKVTSALNTVSTALSGATMSLSAAAVGTTQTLTIAPDTTTMASDISNFVSDYNAVMSTISSLTQFSESDPANAGVLLGDSMVNQITSTFGTIIGSRVSGSGVTATLGDLGISLNTDGTLSLNSTTLTNVLQNNPSKVAAAFNSTNGIGYQLNAKIRTFTQTGGTIALRETALTNDLKSVTDQTNKLQTYITQLTSMYSNQFTALNDLMTSTNSETEYLTQLFGGANNTGTMNKSS